MGYQVYLFRKEVKEQHKTDLSFLENEDLIVKFTKEQFISLKNRLLKYGYEIEREQADVITFNKGTLGIEVRLTLSSVSFSSGFSEEGVFEISITASEFTDTSDFVKLDMQHGWEEL